MNKNMKSAELLSIFRKQGYYFSTSNVAQQVSKEQYTKAITKARKQGIPNFSLWRKIEIAKNNEALLLQFAAIEDRYYDKAD